MSNKNSGDFTNNLGRIYAIYTGGFLAFVIFLAILEQLGVPNKIIGYLFVIFTIMVYAGIGVLSRTMQIGEYYVAGRRVPPVYNGMATAADWMSGASFVGMAGLLFALGYDGLAFVVGWTGGYVLVATLIAPFLRKFGAYTVPDFLAERFGGNSARVIGVVVLFCCSFTYVTAQIYATGIITSRFLGIPFEVAVFVGLMGILLCSMLGGMRAVTWTQVAQYIVLITAYILPVAILSAKKYGLPIPQLTYGMALQEIAVIENELVAAGETVKLYLQPNTTYDPLNFYGLILCLMVGTASLPHVLMRFFTTPTVKDARKSVAWALLFISLLYFTAPAYAAFAKLEVYQSVLGSSLANLPDWIYSYGNIDGLIKVCGVAATDVNAIMAACGSKTTLGLSDLQIGRDVVVLATPEIANLPFVIVGLVAAGGLAAALSTADGLLLAIANALSHDLYFRMVDPKAPTRRRMAAARFLLVIVALFAAWLASTRPSDILSMVAWAFSLAAAGLFPALVLGIWWKRCNSAGAVAGMLAGFGITLFYLVGTQYGWDFQKGTGDELGKWFGVNNISAGLFGLPVGFAVMIVVSLLTPAPSKEMQDLVDNIRRPSGGVILTEKDAI